MDVVYISICNVALEEAHNGDIIVALTASNDIYVTQISPTGSFVWAHRYATTALDEARSIVRMDAGGYLVLGHTASYGDEQLHLRLTNTGGLTWAKTVGNPNGDRPSKKNRVLATSDGGFATTGAIDHLRQEKTL